MHRCSRFLAMDVRLLAVPRSFTVARLVVRPEPAKPVTCSHATIPGKFHSSELDKNFQPRHMAMGYNHPKNCQPTNRTSKQSSKQTKKAANQTSQPLLIAISFQGAISKIAMLPATATFSEFLAGVMEAVAGIHAIVSDMTGRERKCAISYSLVNLPGN